MQYIKTFAIALIISIVCSIGIVSFAYKAMPLFAVDTLGEQMLGTSVTELAGGDTMSDFPTVYNANLTAMNAGKMEISTTTLPLITTLLGLTTIETIETGVWNGTALTVAYGGTGTTTPTDKQIMIGNGVNGFQVIGFGGSGQFLTSAGDGAVPSWTTSSINEAGTYSWTGEHSWTATTTMATSTITELIATNATIASGTISQWATASSSIVSKGYADTFTKVFTNGLTTKADSDATGDQVIAHGLGKIPNKIRVTAIFILGTVLHYSIGTYDAGGQNFVVVAAINQTGTGVAQLLKESGNYNTGVITAIDATNFTITWTKTGSPNSGTYNIFWEAIY